MLAEEYEISTLPNGIHVVTEAMPHAYSVSIGIWVRSGPRYEQPPQAGISHFVEHMLFKGTRTRSARQLNECLYPVGGHLNAFTDREFTCYTAVVLRENIPLAIEVLADMLTNSVYPEEELLRERNVVLEEIKAIEDTPEDLVHDVCASTLWPDHPLGAPIIGHAGTVREFSRDMVLDYVRTRYTPGGVLVSAAGNLNHAEMVEHVDRWLGGLSGPQVEVPMAPPVPHGSMELIYRKTEQAHLCIGMPAFPQKSPENYPLILLDTVLGGGPHSRLFNEIRENRGLAYNVGSAVSAYAEGGMFSVFASTSPANLPAVAEIVRDELATLVREPLSEDELDQAKRHLRASLLLSHESTGSRMGRLASSQLYFDRVVPFVEVIARLEAVTAEDVRQVAARVFRPETSALAVIGPIRPGSRQARTLLAA